MIGLPAESFWEMSPREVYQAINGFREFNTVEKEQPLERDELERMMELYPD